MSKFTEAWLGSDGNLITDGRSHQNIAERYINSVEPDLQDQIEKTDGVSWWDYCYEWMYSHGFARLVLYGGKNLCITTRKEHPQHIPTLINRAKALCKLIEAKELECDRTGRVLWSAEDGI